MKFKIKGRRASRNDHLAQYLLAHIEPDASVIDIGCGPKAYSGPLKQRGNQVLTIDAWSWVEPDIVADLEHADISTLVDHDWDYALMIDFIEHLDRAAGLRLLDNCKKIIRKKIFVLTPLPIIWTDNTKNVEDNNLWSFGNQFDIHKSSWDEQDFAGWNRIHLASLENYYVGYYAT